RALDHAAPVVRRDDRVPAVRGASGHHHQVDVRIRPLSATCNASLEDNARRGIYLRDQGDHCGEGKSLRTGTLAHSLKAPEKLGPPYFFFFGAAFTGAGFFATTFAGTGAGFFAGAGAGLAATFATGLGGGALAIGPGFAGGAFAGAGLGAGGGLI